MGAPTRARADQYGYPAIVLGAHLPVIGVPERELQGEHLIVDIVLLVVAAGGGHRSWPRGEMADAVGPRTVGGGPRRRSPQRLHGPSDDGIGPLQHILYRRLGMDLRCVSVQLDRTTVVIGDVGIRDANRQPARQHGHHAKAGQIAVSRGSHGNHPACAAHRTREQIGSAPRDRVGKQGHRLRILPVAGWRNANIVVREVLMSGPIFAE